MLELKSESSVSEIIEELAASGNIGTAIVLDMQPEELSEGELINIKEGNDFDKKDVKISYR